ncbi:MAG TPA: hypothetical protein VHQ92_01230 [Pseudolabrys sp.]|jgi:hypothetical protein|nr:hypothetical protein [Pseudolabrys sp.]
MSADTKPDLNALRIATKADVEKAFTELRADLLQCRTDLVRWMVGIAILQTAFLAGLLLTLVR